MKAVFVSGRSLSNYAARGHAVPEDVVIEGCISCGQEVTITREGAAIFADARAAGGGAPVGAICDPCALSVSGRFTQVGMTAAGADLVERSPRAKAFASEVLRRMAK